MDTGRARVGPRILGLTGPIGCGKTTVGDILLELGALERIDADRVVHALMAPAGPLIAPIAAAFGDEVVAPDGGVDRARLARIVFADDSALRRLEEIVDPAVHTAIRQRLAELQGGDGTVVVDAVRLLQSDLLPLIEAVWVVRCPVAVQLERLTAIRGMTPGDARARIAAQPVFDHRRVSAVIANDGTLADLRRQVRELWQSWQAPY